MKLLLTENKTIVFFNKVNDFTDKENTEDFLKTIINKLQNNYNLTFKGYYDVIIYTDNIYGFIVCIEKEDLDYLDYFDNQIEMNIKIIETTFIYKLEELIEKKLLKKFTLYKSKDTFYLKPKGKISNIEMGILLENAEIIYKNAEEILKTSERVIIWENQ